MFRLSSLNEGLVCKWFWNREIGGIMRKLIMAGRGFGMGGKNKFWEEEWGDG